MVLVGLVLGAVESEVGGSRGSVVAELVMGGAAS